MTVRPPPWGVYGHDEPMARIKIYALWDSGADTNEIARTVEMPEFRIYAIINRYVALNQVRRNPPWRTAGPSL